MDKPEFVTRDLPCIGKNCKSGGTFQFTANEQRFLMKMVNRGEIGRDGRPMTYTEPRRCKPCRVKKHNFFALKQQFEK